MTRTRKLARRIERVFAVIGILLSIYLGCFDLSAMISDSMAPALMGPEPPPGERRIQAPNRSAIPDHVLSEHVTYRFREPRRWEVVVFRDELGVQVMKRVVGLPGERISIRDSTIVVDGQPLPVPPALASLRYYPFGLLSRGAEITVEDGYFVLGDDSFDSQDSRFEGPLARERIRGRAWWIVWPLDRAGSLAVGS